MTKEKALKYLNSIWFHYEKLSIVLNRAHSEDLIDYKDYVTEAPCAAMDQLKDRIEKTTSKKLTDLIHRDIRRKHWN